MKTRYVFEVGDFQGGGQMIVRNSAGSDIGFLSSVAYKIGFDVKTKKRTRVSLADGLTFVYDTEQQLVDELNNDRRGYRPMTREECRNVAFEVGNRFRSNPAHSGRDNGGQ